MDTPLSPSEVLETIKTLHNKKGETEVAISLIGATKAGLKKEEDKTPFDTLLDLENSKDINGQPQEEITPVEELILQAFRTLSKKQKVRIITGFLINHKKDINKDLTQKEKQESEENKKMFELKTFFAKIVMVCAILVLFTIMGLFVYSVLVPTTAVPVSAVTGIFGMFQEIFKIIFTTPIH